MAKAVIIAGSVKDSLHVNKIKAFLEQLMVEVNVHYDSAHKKTRDVLLLIDDYNTRKGVVFVTVAGRSNALSGVVAGNTHHPVVACPPFKSTADYAIDIHSTLRMPSQCPVLTVISPENCALAVKRIMDFKDA